MTFTPDRRHVLAGLAGLSLSGSAVLAADAEGDEDTPNIGFTEDYVIGDAEAPLTVIEYVSHSCPACAAFHMHVWPQVKENYVDTGKVKFVLRAFLRNQADLYAEMTARCGGEQGYYPLADVFLSTQSSWTRSSDLLGEVRQIGRRIGLSPGQLDACFAELPACFGSGGDALDCLKANPYAYAIFNKFEQEARDDGINSTPTFIIGGDKHTGVTPYEEFKLLLDDKLS